MHRKLILIATLIVLAAMGVQAHQRNVQSATTRLGWPPAPTAKFIASTEKTFDKLMADAMNVMHEGMHSAPYTGEPDRDFLTLMIPHHQGAIDMAKALLLYGKDPQMRRLGPRDYHRPAIGNSANATLAEAAWRALAKSNSEAGSRRKQTLT